MHKLIKYLKGYKLQAILAPFFKFLEACFELIVPLVVSAIINKIDAGAGSVKYVLCACLILVALGVIGLICSVSAQWFAAKASVGVAKDLRHDLFDKMQRFSYTDIDNMGAGKMITRMTNDVNQIQTGVNLFLRIILRSPFMIVGAVVLAFVINAVAGGIFTITIIILSAVVFCIMLVSIPLYKRVQENVESITLSTRETLSGVRVIRAFCKQQDEIKEFNSRSKKLNHSQIFVGRIAALMNPLTFAIINVAIVILLYFSAVKFNIGVLTRGDVVALYNYMSQILVELFKCSKLGLNMIKTIASVGRVNEILNKNCEEVETKQQRTGSEHFIEFKNVSVNYGNATVNALTNVSFTAEKGEIVGIIGGTGAGKSSLINLIPHFYDACEGEVLLKGENVKNFGDKRLREICGIVPQQAVIFEGSIRDNIKWGKNDATDEEILLAIKQAEAYDIIKSKKDGLNENVVQGGKNFSGGQKQRLTIARALVKKPEILILDDSSSALDYATDLKLRKTLKKLSYKPTVFIVSQRTSSIMYADKIIVLDEGRVVGIGQHNDLLKNCKIYREIYNIQFKKGEHNG